MDFIITAIIIATIVLTIKVFFYYRPKIDFVINDTEKSIILWYSIQKDGWDIRKHIILLTF